MTLPGGGGSGDMVPKNYCQGVVVTLPGDGGSEGMVPNFFWTLTTFFKIQFKNTSNLNFHLKDFFTKISKHVLFFEIFGFKSFKI